MKKLNIIEASDLDISSMTQNEALDALDQCTHLKQVITKQGQKIRGVLDKSLGQRLFARLQSDGVDTGTRTFDISEGCKVEASIAPKITWDQEKLINGLDSIAKDYGKESANHYAQVKWTVSETKFKSAPPEIKKLLQKARTVVPSSPTYKLKFSMGEK
tara:strand:+ start:832 stop:1308 length:477 start_codon:yes stop_codon:yes gene_type:complete